MLPVSHYMYVARIYAQAWVALSASPRLDSLPVMQEDAIRCCVVLCPTSTRLRMAFHRRLEVAVDDGEMIEADKILLHL